MSELKVNKISPSSGTAFTIGDSGDTFTVPSGATLTVAGTFTQTGAQTFDGGVDIDNFNINGTTITLSSGDMTLDVAGDIILNADGGDIKFADASVDLLSITNSSSDVVLKPLTDTKDIIFQQYDGTEVARIEDNATFNVSSAGKFAYAGTAVTSTAAELNILDGGTSATSTTIADADRVVLNDNGTMVQAAVTDLAAYLDDEITAMPNLITIAAAGTASTVAGIPLYSLGTSMYTHDVSSTDNSADYNAAFGSSALSAITTGDKNVAIGYQAGTAAQTTSDSVIIGVQAGAALTGGQNNIIMGVNALDTATTCDENIAIGMHSLGGSLDDATKNVCMGRYTGENITTGDNNTFIGYDAGSDQTTAGGNTFIGYKCGHGPATGGSNNAVGSDSMAAMTSGYYNNALGSSTLYACTEGHNNIAIGHDAAYNLTTGDHNTYIGYKAKASAVGVDNEIVIGHGVHITSMTGGGTGTVRIGMHNNKITNTFTSNANWSHSSDERWKKNIADNPIGLDFINDLRTVTYNWRAFSEIDPSLSEYNAEDTEYSHPEIQHGLIAQEVKTAMDKHGIEQFGGWHEDQTHEDKQQGISESMYVIPLIKAVQELSAKVKDLELKLEDK